MSPALHSHHLLYRKTQRTARSTQKLVCFQWGGESYALPIQRVQRILREFVRQDSTEQGPVLVSYGETVMTVLDLPRLSHQSTVAPVPDHLIVYLSEQGEPLGILSNGVPKIVEVAVDQIQALPNAYRQRCPAAALEKLVRADNGHVMFYLNPEKL